MNRRSFLKTLGACAAAVTSGITSVFAHGVDPQKEVEAEWKRIRPYIPDFVRTVATLNFPCESDVFEGSVVYLSQDGKAVCATPDTIDYPIVLGRATKVRDGKCQIRLPA